jgi:hypothetical protein
MFTPLASAAADYVKWGLTDKQRAKIGWLREWVETWARLRGDFLREYELDPAITYVPLAQVHRDFHASKAYIRFFAAGNGTSKSSAGFYEDYLAATGQKWWRNNRGNVCVVGVQQKSWGNQVFKPKFLDGEPNNFFSPLFPDGGRWFKRYDKPDGYIELACGDCAAKNRPKRCTHEKQSSRIYVASDMSGWQAIQGGSFVLGHIDEHANDAGIFSELKIRTRRGDTRGRIIITATPLFGEEAWEKKELWKVWEGNQDLNWQSKSTGERWIEIFTCSMQTAALLPPEQIEALERSYSKTEALARIHGLPVSIAEAHAFDFHRLDEMKSSQVADPDRGWKVEKKDSELDLVEIDLREEVELVPDESVKGSLRLWSKPKPTSTYIISADPAGGMSVDRGDPSCAYVMEVLAGADRLIRLRVVAEWHGWSDAFDFGREIKKLALYYNEALVVPETTGGHGRALVLMLGRELNYQNIYQDDTPDTSVRYEAIDRLGADTNVSSKRLMLEALRRYINNRLLILPDADAYLELFAYEEKRTELGNFRYGGAQGSHDDRVMALALACYACVRSPDQVYFQEKPGG